VDFDGAGMGLGEALDNGLDNGLDKALGTEFAKGLGVGVRFNKSFKYWLATCPFIAVLHASLTNCW